MISSTITAEGRIKPSSMPTGRSWRKKMWFIFLISKCAWRILRRSVWRKKIRLWGKSSINILRSFCFRRKKKSNRLTERGTQYQRSIAMFLQRWNFLSRKIGRWRMSSLSWVCHSAVPQRTSLVLTRCLKGSMWRWCNLDSNYWRRRI